MCDGATEKNVRYKHSLMVSTAAAAAAHIHTHTFIQTHGVIIIATTNTTVAHKFFGLDCDFEIWIFSCAFKRHLCRGNGRFYSDFPMIDGKFVLHFRLKSAWIDYFRIDFPTALLNKWKENMDVSTYYFLLCVFPFSLYIYYVLQHTVHCDMYGLLLPPMPVRACLYLYSSLGYYCVCASLLNITFFWSHANKSRLKTYQMANAHRIQNPINKFP